MQAAHENYSFIKVNFGDSQHEQKSPVDISLILDLFSQEVYSSTFSKTSLENRSKLQVQFSFLKLASHLFSIQRVLLPSKLLNV